MSRLATALIWAALTGVVPPLLAQTSPSGVNSTSPGSEPLTGGSFVPGSGVPSQPVPAFGGTGASTGNAGGAPPATGSLPGNAVIERAEVDRCNVMTGLARDQCLSDLRARFESAVNAPASTGLGARTTPSAPVPATGSGY